jgi:hypothetical protein
LQTGDACADRVRGGQHQDPGCVRRLDQPGAHLVAGDLGQIPVEDHHVVVVDVEALQGLVAVVGDIDGHRVPPQPGGDGVGQQPFVLHHQHPHPAIVPGQPVRSAFGRR